MIIKIVFMLAGRRMSSNVSATYNIGQQNMQTNSHSMGRAIKFVRFDPSELQKIIPGTSFYFYLILFSGTRLGHGANVASLLSSSYLNAVMYSMHIVTYCHIRSYSDS